MEIKAADVAKLRAMTGAGMMDCKKALVEAEGDFDRAQDIIREKGKLVAAKRATALLRRVSLPRRLWVRRATCSASLAKPTLWLRMLISSLLPMQILDIAARSRCG